MLVCDLLTQLMLSPSDMANQTVAVRPIAAAELTFAESLSYKLFAQSCTNPVHAT